LIQCVEKTETIQTMINYKKILIKNGNVFDIANKKAGVFDVLIDSSRIKKIS